ncbi:spermidine synthase [Demequina sp. TTPB684]|uniref:spermidine synthase n=1 Tax=unclassified Demequina TaxID=2620311 RepID=UPI001CF5607D|nr:spermidine synthase [Demequina sp. TMPB413]MCB2412777.1 spermidine synthase [Demequina sp. TTPB684]UPU87124.1 spermidine synthase [Demequina sp. TMPB413]
MSARFEELDWSATPIGEVSLRRRRDPVTGEDVYEVKLNDEWLMSSQFTAAEIALARLGLARVAQPHPTVVVGGLGLGYTAAAALEDANVGELLVVELLAPVIDWHERGLVPLGPALTSSQRCRFVHGDFFGMSYGDGYDPAHMDRQVDAILLDIDHSPTHLLDDGSVGFYGVEGMRAVASHLRPGGVYAMWSNDPPDAAYLAVLHKVFADVVAEVITFPNPLQRREATATVYVATKP